MTTEETKEIQLQFLESMKNFNYPKWVNEKNRQYSLNLSFSGVSHVANGLISLTMQYAGEHSPNGFLSEVMKDSLIGACSRADATNIMALPIYADFIYNMVPVDLRVKK